jgi:hypothetical protein
MNSTQWLFELESLYAEEEKKIKDFAETYKAIKKDLINMLGLNIMPIEEEVYIEGTGENVIKFRRAKDEEYIPMSVFTCNEGLLSELLRKNKELLDQEKADDFCESDDMTVEELEDYVNEGIPEFLDDQDKLDKYLVWNSPKTKKLLDTLVTPISDDVEENLSENTKKSCKPRIVIEDGN